MDIKVGAGAFMPEVEDARRLANNICRVAVECGVACNAIITDMNHPIAWSAGNSLEVAEAISYLSGGRRHARLHTLVIEIAAELLLLGGLEKDFVTAKNRLNRVLDSGAAAERFATMIAAQGGPADFLEHSASYLPSALVVRPVTAGTSGFVKMVDVKSVGKVVVRLGGGRLRSEDGIDHSVGITDLCQPGLQLDPDTPLAIIHARNDEQWSLAARSIQGAVQVANDMSAWISSPVIRDRIEGGITK
jgi:thymidine phosphorylase